MVACKPINKSEINRLTMGIKNTTHRLLKPLLDNKAMAAIGVKLGGWGRNLDRIAKKSVRPKKHSYLSYINNHLSNIQNNQLFGQIHFPPRIQIVKLIFLKTVNKQYTFSCRFHFRSQLFVNVRKLIEGKYRLLNGIAL